MSAPTKEFRLCRFCTGASACLVRYGTRHYAHTKCLIEAKGEAFILALPLGYLGDIEVFALSEHTRKEVLDRLAADSWRLPRATPEAK